MTNEDKICSSAAYVLFYARKDVSIPDSKLEYKESDDVKEQEDDENENENDDNDNDNDNDDNDNADEDQENLVVEHATSDDDTTMRDVDPSVENEGTARDDEYESESEEDKPDLH